MDKLKIQESKNVADCGNCGLYEPNEPADGLGVCHLRRPQRVRVYDYCEQFVVSL
jgi:hypothetical protein